MNGIGTGETVHCVYLISDSEAGVTRGRTITKECLGVMWVGRASIGVCWVESSGILS